MPYCRIICCPWASVFCSFSDYVCFHIVSSTDQLGGQIFKQSYLVGACFSEVDSLTVAFWAEITKVKETLNKSVLCNTQYIDTHTPLRHQRHHYEIWQVMVGKMATWMEERRNPYKILFGISLEKQSSRRPVR